MKRRDLLKAFGLASCLTPFGVMSYSGASAGQSIIPAIPKRALRIAHVTDIHVKPGLRAPRGLARCFHHIQDLPEKVDLILNGGDSIMDALSRDKSTVSKQWNVWNKVLENECSLNMANCIGNHDIWGAGSKDDALYGKSWALDSLSMHKPYWSFDKSGWHFIILDSVQLKPEGGYIAKLDEEQFDWLKSDLRKVDEKTPVLVMSHIPILSAAAFLDGERAIEGNWNIPGSFVHIDSRDIIDLFYKHKNVKVCLSGHLHLLDKVEYNGITFLCNGAVSGNWWYGAYKETKPGYALLNLYEDGSFDHEYVTYRNS
jgi:3',5'-cyclic AMP phosphodiesterase CpdA